VHRFKYLVDGRWVIDLAGDTEADAGGNTNNVVVVADAGSPPPRALRRAALAGAAVVGEGEVAAAAATAVTVTREPRLWSEDNGGEGAAEEAPKPWSSAEEMEVGRGAGGGALLLLHYTRQVCMAVVAPTAPFYPIPGVRRPWRVLAPPAWPSTRGWACSLGMCCTEELPMLPRLLTPTPGPPCLHAPPPPAPPPPPHTHPSIQPFRGVWMNRCRSTVCSSAALPFPLTNDCHACNLFPTLVQFCVETHWCHTPVLLYVLHP
jgi:hypothetical protein